MSISAGRSCWLVLLQVAWTATLACGLNAQDSSKTSAPVTGSQDYENDKPPKVPAVKEGWKPLLRPKSLAGWEVTQFGGEGEVKVEDGQVILNMGDPLTGITFKGKDFPKSNFEIKLEAQRIQGNDFLCGLTFPIGDQHASLICGGWGGGVVGLSSVDGNDASENSTSTFMDFKNGQWYSFRVRVDDENVTAWIDDEQVLQQERKGHDFSVRAEVMSNRPLGFCAFQSKVAVRNFAWRPLTKQEQKGLPDQKKAAVEKSTSAESPKQREVQQAAVISDN